MKLTQLPLDVDLSHTAIVSADCFAAEATTFSSDGRLGAAPSNNGHVIDIFSMESGRQFQIVHTIRLIPKQDDEDEDDSQSSRRQQRYMSTSTLNTASGSNPLLKLVFSPCSTMLMAFRKSTRLRAPLELIVFRVYTGTRAAHDTSISLTSYSAAEITCEFSPCANFCVVLLTPDGSDMRLNAQIDVIVYETSSWRKIFFTCLSGVTVEHAAVEEPQQQQQQQTETGRILRIRVVTHEVLTFEGKSTTKNCVAVSTVLIEDRGQMLTSSTTSEVLDGISNVVFISPCGTKFFACKNGPTSELVLFDMMWGDNTGSNLADTNLQLQLPHLCIGSGRRLLLNNDFDVWRLPAGAAASSPFSSTIPRRTHFQAQLDAGDLLRAPQNVQTQHLPADPSRILCVRNTSNITREASLWLLEE